MSGVAPQDIFDSEESVLKALSVIRNSILAPEEKSHLRDLFLDYAGEVSEDRRASLREEILNKLRPHSAALPTLSIARDTGLSKPEKSSTTNKSEKVPPTSSTLGTQRPIPSFKANVSEKVASNPPEATAALEPRTEPTPMSKEPKVTESPREVVETPMTAPLDLRAMIDSIKHDINGKVGNPVNLINADEKIGREYMSALLDAMKSTSGGGGAAPAAARLEKAYKAALILIEKMPTSDIPAVAESASEPKLETPKIEKVEETPEPPTPSVEPLPEPTPSSTEANTPKEELPIIEPQAESSKSHGLYHQPIDETDEILKSKELIEKKEEPRPEEETKKTEVFKSTERHLKIGVPKITATKKSEPLHPLKDEMTLPEQMAKIKAEAVKREEENRKPITDLNSPQVQGGLEQLLSEWKLFSSSGFLGTGPKGINHPLYKQLSGLPMAAVVAGRFEGVTPPIRQSITDYMNGWRYEQGVVHEMGETFENYLRRVIKQILTRQRLSPSS